MATEFSFEVTKEIGVISTNDKGYTKELNLVSFNGSEPKVDIRNWAPNREKMLKGISLTIEEAQELYKLLGQLGEEIGKEL